jgi:hypothetical protein
MRTMIRSLGVNTPSYLRPGLESWSDSELTPLVTRFTLPLTMSSEMSTMPETAAMRTVTLGLYTREGIKECRLTRRDPGWG